MTQRPNPVPYNYLPTEKPLFAALHEQVGKSNCFSILNKIVIPHEERSSFLGPNQKLLNFSRI